jgi:tetratricopeptide (TPR) repeat protein
MLMKIINIKDDKFHKEKIGMNRRLQEEVTSRIIRDPNAMQVAVLPMRDAGGEDFIHYALQIPEPGDYTLTRYKDRYYLAMEVKVRVLDAKKNLIYETSREAISYFEEKELDEVRSRPYSFEDRLPVVPGNYLVEFSLLNRATRSYYKASATLEVESQPVSSIAVGRPLFIQKCSASAVAEEPFFMGGSRCTPQARLELPGGDRASVNLLLPVYVPIPTAETAAQPLKIQYTMGRLDRSIQPKVIEDSLDRRRVNKFGTLMVGKSLPLSGLADGSYILSIKVSDPITKRTTGTTVPVRLGGTPLPPPNIMTAAEGQKDEREGNNDYWRGLCARAQSENEKAKMLFARALERNDKNLGARSQLAGYYFEAGDYQKVTSLLEAGDFSNLNEPDTIVRLVVSLEKTGQLRKAIQTAEAALKRIEPTRGFYEELAGLYDKAGQVNRAREAREEARKLTKEDSSY